mgnify:CR=1 FL=1
MNDFNMVLIKLSNLFSLLMDAKSGKSLKTNYKWFIKHSFEVGKKVLNFKFELL